MGRFDDLFSNTQTIQPPVQPTGGRFDDLFQKSTIPPVSPKIQQLQQEVAQTGAEAEKSGSILGMAKNAVLDVFNRLALRPLQPVAQAGEEIAQGIKEKNPAEAVSGLLRFGARSIGAAFTPVSLAFEEAQKVPVLKQAADLLVGLPATVVGSTGEFIGDKFTDAIPFISEDTRNTLRPAFKEVGSLAGQIWLGNRVFETILKGKEVTPEDVNTFKDEARHIIPSEEPPGGGGGGGGGVSIPIRQKESVQIPIKGTSKNIPINIRTPFFDNPPIPNEELPVINVGRNQKGELPVIQLQTQTNIDKLSRGERVTIGGLTYEPIPQERAVIQVSKVPGKPEVPSKNVIKLNPIKTGVATEIPTIGEIPKTITGEIPPKTPAIPKSEIPKETPVVKEVPQEPTAIIGGEKPSGIAKKISALAVEKGLTDSGFSELAGFDPITLKKQSELIADLASDMERVKRIVRGEEFLPPEINKGAFVREINDIATKNRDIGLLKDLGRSTLAGKTSEAAQTLGALRGFEEPVTKVVKEITEIRQKRAERTNKNIGETKIEMINKAKANIAKPNFQEVKDFIFNIVKVC